MGKWMPSGWVGLTWGCWLTISGTPCIRVQKMVRFIKQTPVVDGAGLKNTLENRLAFIDQSTDRRLRVREGKKAFIVLGADRWGMTKSFLDAGYECVFGDLMFGLGLPFACAAKKSSRRLADLVMPVAGRLPFEWIYPTGEKQNSASPNGRSITSGATVIAGDCHYVKRHLPDQLEEGDRYQYYHAGGRRCVSPGWVSNIWSPLRRSWKAVRLARI